MSARVVADDARLDQPRRGPVGGWIASHPVSAFVILAIGLTWIADVTAILLLHSIFPGLLAELVILLGVATLVTGIAEGRPGLRRLYGAVVRVRVGFIWYVVALVALPVLTVLVALATGTFSSPAGGWLPVLVSYLLGTIVLGAILGNIWEELAWSGVVQRRLMDRHGVLGGSLLAAIPFALIHLPMVFGSGFNVPLDSVLISWAVLIGTAPFFRYLIGMTYVGARGSLLIVGLLHASFNASGSLPVFDGFWQSIVAMVVLMGLVFLYRAVRLRRGTEGERAALRPGHRTAAAV